MAQFDHNVTAPDVTARLAHSGQILVRSGIEIDRVLASMVEAGVTVSATLPSKVLFLSRLIQVDPVKQYLLLGYSDNRAANEEVIATRSIVLRCNHRGAQWAFSCANLQASTLERRHVLQAGLPTALLGVQHGRTAARAKVPEPAEIHCRVPLGAQSFNARLTDVSLDGTAFLVSDDPIALPAGARITGVQIRRADSEPLLADIEVRHVIPAILANGRRGLRIACRIIAKPGDLEELIRLFVVDLQ